MKQKTRQTLRQVRMRTTALLIIFAMTVTSIMSIPATKVSAAGNSDVDNNAKVTFENHSYQLFDDEDVSWSYAKEYCENQGGHLVTITSQDEQDFLDELIKNGTKDGYWIGANDFENEGDYRWITGEEFSYTNWRYDQPDNDFDGTEDFLHLWTEGKWNDNVDDDWKLSIGFICEWDGSKPEGNVDNWYSDQIKQKFIDEHMEFIELGQFYNFVNGSSVQDSIIGNSDYESARKSYDTWNTAMLKIFDNPFDVVVADYILSSDVQNALQEIGSVELKNTQGKIIGDIINLIDEKGELTDDYKPKIAELFEDKDYSDKETYNILKKCLHNVDEEELQKVFEVYDKTNLSIGILEDGLDIVKGVGNTIQYCSTLNAYIVASDYLKQMFKDLEVECQKGQLPNTAYNPRMIVKALNKYLDATEENSAKYIAEKFVGESIPVIADIFGELFKSKVKNFLVSAISNKVSKSVLKKLTGANGFIVGAEIGYSVGKAICDGILNLSDSADAYSTFYASAEMATYLNAVLNNAKDKFYEDQTYENAIMFCEYYRMYQKLQINILDNGIKYCSAVDSAWYSKIFNKESMFALSNVFLARKAYWMEYSCPLLENIGIQVDTPVRLITVACPVDVNITDSNGNTVVEIKSGEVTRDGDYAEVLVSDNIKYIALLNNGDYKINITATDDGKMDYYVTDLDKELNVKLTTAYSGISLTNGKKYSGNLQQSTDNTKMDYKLITDGKAVSCDSVTYDTDSYVNIESITIDKDKLELSKGDTIKLSAQISPANATAKTVSWASSDESVVTLDEYGNVKAVSEGTATIYCYGIFSDAITSIPVTVKGNGVGDLNGDGKIDGKDSTLIARYLVGWNVTVDKSAADINKDGKIDGKDSTLLRRYIAGWDVELG